MSAETKLQLSGLIDSAVRDGWAHRRACAVLDIADVRAHRWRQRLRDTVDCRYRDPGGGAVHGLLSWRRSYTLILIEEWGHLSLLIAIRSRTAAAGWVWCSLPSTVLRIALKHKVHLPGSRIGRGRLRLLFLRFRGAQPDLDLGRDNALHACRTVAYAIVDVVTRYWIGYLSSQYNYTQAQLLFARALQVSAPCRWSTAGIRG